jgi:hypothetical protein
VRGIVDVDSQVRPPSALLSGAGSTAAASAESRIGVAVKIRHEVPQHDGVLANPIQLCRPAGVRPDYASASRMERSALIADAVWVFTDPRLMPMTEAICASLISP